MDPVERYERKELTTLGKKIGYVDVGAGDPVVFLHGIGGSSYGWRNVIPTLARHNRCVAVDLVGMGASAKLEPSGQSSYDFVDFYKYLDAALGLLEVERNAIIVIHEFGALLGLEWARNHPAAIRGLAYTEAIIGPLSSEDLPEATRELIHRLRGPDGEQAILETPVFFDTLFAKQTLRRLSPAERERYVRPFVDAGESRRALERAINLIPLDGRPLKMVLRATRQMEWLAGTDFPKLRIECQPGYLSPRIAERIGPLKNESQTTVVAGHLPQEDSPMHMATALVDWIESLES